MENKVFGVRIKNRSNGKYMNKVWTELKNAKLAVCPNLIFYVENFKDFESKYKDELDSDFIIMYEDGTVEVQPVLDYYIDYYKRQSNDYWKNKMILDGLKKIQGETE